MESPRIALNEWTSVDRKESNLQRCHVNRKPRAKSKLPRQHLQDLGCASCGQICSPLLCEWEGQIHLTQEFTQASTRWRRYSQHLPCSPPARCFAETLEATCTCNQHAHPPSRSSYVESCLFCMLSAKKHQPVSAARFITTCKRRSVQVPRVLRRYAERRLRAEQCWYAITKPTKPDLAFFAYLCVAWSLVRASMIDKL